MCQVANAVSLQAGQDGLLCDLHSVGAWWRVLHEEMYFHTHANQHHMAKEHLQMVAAHLNGVCMVCGIACHTF